MNTASTHLMNVSRKHARLNSTTLVFHRMKEPEPEPESATVLAAPRMEGHHLAIDLETKWHWRHWTGSCCW